ncbi:MAG: hypothetical protein AAB257_04340 [Nitrospinota bacterium]
MKAVTALFISFLFIFALPCAAQDVHIKVKEVRGKEALIKDNKTGEEKRITEGEPIDNGWTVIEVTDDHVTIEKQISPHEKVRGIIPVEGIMETEVK